MVCSENNEPVRKSDFVKFTPNGSMPVTDTGEKSSSVYNKCNIINFVTPEKPSPEMVELMKSMTNMGKKQETVPRRMQKSEFDDEEFDRLAMEIDLERVEKEYYEKKTDTTVRRTQTTVRNPYLKRTMQTTRTIRKRARVENPYVTQKNRTSVVVKNPYKK